jgi:hypothetical protein
MRPFTKKLYSRPMIGVKKEEETLCSGLWPENRFVRLQNWPKDHKQPTCS